MVDEIQAVAYYVNYPQLSQLSHYLSGSEINHKLLDLESCSELEDRQFGGPPRSLTSFARSLKK